MKKNVIYLLLVITILVLSCGEQASKEAVSSDTQGLQKGIGLTRAQFESGGMSLGSLVEKSFPIWVEASGVIDVPPENRAIVSAPMGGYVKETPLLVGDQVNKGQVLVTLENPEFVRLQQEFLEIQTQLTYLESEYERQKTLYEEKISSQKNYLRAQSEYETARARYNGLRKQLLLLNLSPEKLTYETIRTAISIPAPIKGSITAINTAKGMYVSPESPMLEIVNNEHIHLELAIFEKDIMKLKKGQEISFKIPESSADTYEANVYLIGTSIDQNRTVKVHAHIKEESKYNFIKGMFVQAAIACDSILVKALPSEAVVDLAAASRVLVLRSENKTDYLFEPVEVKTGLSQNGYTAILNAGEFETSDRFLVKGAFSLLRE